MTLLEKLIVALEPFALTLIVLSGASLAGWITFTNADIVGVVTFGAGILLIIKHVTERTRQLNEK